MNHHEVFQLKYINFNNYALCLQFHGTVLTHQSLVATLAAASSKGIPTEYNISLDCNGLM